MPRDLLTPTSQ